MPYKTWTATEKPTAADINANFAQAVNISALKFGGTGADGALNISSGTTTLDLGGVSVYVKNYSSISITGTAKLAFSNPATRGTIIILKCSGNAVITSSTVPAIDASGMGAAAGNDGYSFVASPRIGIGTDAFDGAAAYHGGMRGLSPRLLAGINGKMIPLACGAGGNSGSYGAGGRGGGALYIEVAGALNISSTINASGIAGSAANPSGAGSGGGGGGAGVIIIAYATLTANTGTYTVTGGTGGGGTSTNMGNQYGAVGSGGGAGAGADGGNGGGFGSGDWNRNAASGDGGAGIYGVFLNTEWL